MQVWANEQYMQVAVESGTDMIFMFEAFADTATTEPCRKRPVIGPRPNENWLDLTCVYPTPTGHEQIANAFGAVIAE